MRAFDKQLSIIGKLKYSDVTLESVRANIYYNRLDGKELKADVFSHSREDYGVMIMSENFNNNAEFFASVGDLSVYFKGALRGFSFRDPSGHFGTAKLKEFSQISWLDSSTPTKAVFTFFITDSQLFRRRERRIKHAVKGLLYGYDLKNDKFTPEEKTLTIGKWHITGRTVPIFEDSEDGVILSKDQIQLRFAVEGVALDIDKEFEDAKTFLNGFLQVLKVVEHRNIVTTSAEVSAKNGENHVASGQVYFDNTALPKYADGNLDHASQETLESLKVHTEAYLALGPPMRQKVDKIIRRFIQSTDPNLFYEVKVVHLHSALELLIKQFNPTKSGSGFSQQLVKAANSAGIDVFGYFNEKREAIMRERRADKFLLTIVRNAYLHDGGLPDDLMDRGLAEAFTNGKKLASAMILKLLNSFAPIVDASAN